MKVTEMYAWICEEEDGSEGLPAFRADIAGTPTMMPLVGAEVPRMDALRHIAIDLQKASGRPFKLVRFTNMEILERIE